jgi:hypothetical protein
VKLQPKIYQNNQMHQLSLQFMHFHVTFLYFGFCKISFLCYHCLYQFYMLSFLFSLRVYPFFIIILINQFGRFLSCYNFYYHIVLPFIVPNPSSFLFVKNLTHVSGISTVLSKTSVSSPGLGNQYCFE